MELDAFNKQFPVSHPHDDSVVCPCSDFKTIGQCFSLDYKRMVTGGFKGIRQSFEQCFSIMMDKGSLAMHEERRPYYVAAVSSAY